MSYSQNYWVGEWGSPEPTVRPLPEVEQDLEQLTLLRMLIDAIKLVGKAQYLRDILVSSHSPGEHWLMDGPRQQ